MPIFAVITTFLGQTKVRFHLYNQPVSLEEKFRAAAELPGYDGVEIVFPYEVQDLQKTRRLLDSYGLSVSAVNVNVKGEPEFIDGGLSSTDQGIRKKTVGFVKEAKDFAAQIGVPRGNCCPLGDGFEFVFQKDYRKCWSTSRRRCLASDRYIERTARLVDSRNGTSSGRRIKRVEKKGKRRECG